MLSLGSGPPGNVHAPTSYQYTKAQKPLVTVVVKKASIRWQDSAPPISGYWPTSEPNSG